MLEAILKMFDIKKIAFVLIKLILSKLLKLISEKNEKIGNFINDFNDIYTKMNEVNIVMSSVEKINDSKKLSASLRSSSMNLLSNTKIKDLIEDIDEKIKECD